MIYKLSQLTTDINVDPMEVKKGDYITMDRKEIRCPNCNTPFDAIAKVENSAECGNGCHKVMVLSVECGKCKESSEVMIAVQKIDMEKVREMEETAKRVRCHLMN